MGMNGKDLGEGIGAVEGTGNVLDDELELADTVTQPVKSHVHGLAALGLHRGGGQPDGHFVVAGKRGGGLGVAEVVEGAANVGGDLGVAVEGAVLCLGNGSADYGDASGEAEDGGVIEGGVGLTEELKPACSAARLGAR